MSQKKRQALTHLGSVQRLATERNGRVEILVDFILREFSAQLHQAGYTADLQESQRQAIFERDDCNDRFDHYLELEVIHPIGDIKGSFQIWGQTTCYKGNDTGEAESDKTYEIRETLTEALGLRRWLRDENVKFRTIHFTVGPSQYTYAWFETVKRCAFDLSIYLDVTLDPSALFKETELLLNSGMTEEEMHEQLRIAAKTPGSQVGQFINDALKQLHQWLNEGFPTNTIADQQAELLSNLRQSQQEVLVRSLSDPLDGNLNIKERTRKLFNGGETDDVLLIRTLKRLTKKKPFLPAALDALANWPTWSKAHFVIPSGCQDLAEYVRYLVNMPGSGKLINRRLLLRIHSDEGVNYVQDIGIRGLDEHTVYKVDYTPEQTQEFVQKVVASCLGADIKTPSELFIQLTGRRGRQLLKASFALESKNGTTLTPSLDYLEEALGEHYNVVPFKATSLPKPLAYHANFGATGVGPYTSFKVVVSRKTRLPIAIIKGKFFSQDEFGRRAKEEAYVGFTTKFKYEKGIFKERYPGIPFIMFIDIDSDCEPLEYGITKLVNSGWEVFFSIKKLIDYLSELEKEQKQNAPLHAQNIKDVTSSLVEDVIQIQNYTQSKLFSDIDDEDAV